MRLECRTSTMEIGQDDPGDWRVAIKDDRSGAVEINIRDLIAFGQACSALMKAYERGVDIKL